MNTEYHRTWYAYKITRQMICAGYPEKGEKDTCSGDSGGKTKTHHCKANLCKMAD